MKQLRILHCRQGDRVWGPERQILQLAERLPSYGISMEIVLLRRWGLDAAPHPLANQARAFGCEVTEVSARPHEWPKVVRVLQERLRHCDLLHTHEFKSDLLGYPAARLSHRPWVATDHHLAEDDDFMLRAFGRADRWALGRAQAVVVPSRSQAERLTPSVAPERIHVIYHGIDANAFARTADHSRQRIREEHGVGESQPVVAIIGRLEPVKGHRDFLNAAQLILAQRPDVHFWIIGEGKLRQNLAQQTNDLGISAAVTFLGYQADVASFMAASDLILMPSHHESFGIVLIEAMSLAKPVVASATGGIPEVVVDGDNGYLTRPGDPQQLSERVLQMLNNATAAADFGQKGLRRVSQHFTLDQMAGRMADLYQAVIANNRDDKANVPSYRNAPLSIP